MTRLSPMRCSRNVINQSRGIVSKYARMSASTIQLTLRRSMPVLQAVTNQYFALGLFNGAAVVGLAIVFDRVTQSYGRRIEAQRQS